MTALKEKQKWNKLQFMFPDEGEYRRELYAPHVEFMNKGSEHRFRVIMGANRSGKSFTVGYEFACHILGEYPSWWKGRVFKKPTTFWIIAESGALFRDSLQKLLFGEAGEEVGTGFLPLADKNNGVGITSYNSMPGIPGAIGSAIVKHKKGHSVSVVIKTNEMQREQFQAAKVNGILFDEEPRPDIYTECLMRLMGTGKGQEPGLAVLAFTPMKGLSDVVLQFLPKGQFPEKGYPLEDPQKYICRVEWSQAPHLSEEDRKTMISQIPRNERDARTKGIPSLGSGRIYTIDEDQVIIKPFELPEYWPIAYGYDFGYHKTAVVWVAQDPKTHIYYVYGEYKNGEVPDYVHAQCVKERGQWIRGAADPSGGGRRDDGSMRIDYMRKLGLDLVPGKNALYAGISHILNLFESGQLKIFSNLEKLISELRLYRWDVNNPNIPARNQEDHLLDALRYLLSIFGYIAMSVNDNDQFNNFTYNDRYVSSNRDDLTGY